MTASPAPKASAKRKARDGVKFAGVCLALAFAIAIALHIAAQHIGGK